MNTLGPCVPICVGERVIDGGRSIGPLRVFGAEKMREERLLLAVVKPLGGSARDPDVARQYIRLICIAMRDWRAGPEGGPSGKVG